MVKGEVPLVIEHATTAATPGALRLISQLAPLLFCMGVDAHGSVTSSSDAIFYLCCGIACCRAAKQDRNILNVDTDDVSAIERDLEARLTSQLSVMTSDDSGEVVKEILLKSKENGFVTSFGAKVLMDKMNEPALATVDFSDIQQ